MWLRRVGLQPPSWHANLWSSYWVGPLPIPYVIPCLRPLGNSLFLIMSHQTLPRETSAFWLFSSYYNALSSTVIALNNFSSPPFDQNQFNTLPKLFLLNDFSMTANVKRTVEQKSQNFLRNPHCLSAGSDSLYVQLMSTALKYPRKHTNCAPGP